MASKNSSKTITIKPKPFSNLYNLRRNFQRMQKGLILIILLLLLPLTLAQNNLYVADSLELQLDVQGSYELVPQAANAQIKEVSADLLLYPVESFRQKVSKLDALGGEVQENAIKYTWKDPPMGTNKFGYSAILRTNNQLNRVRSKIPFPLSTIQGYEQYTLPSAKIDSNNPAVIAQAATLAAGENDEFKLAFKIANWVAENVHYELNALTTNQAQKASWVLEHREGACDEMTSLFVAMMRSLGIPARFVSGISFTESPEVLKTLGTTWAGHGWAEVYFPSVGWVSFDITFDEYGYVDPTHIILRESLDPDDPATKYEWISQNVNLNPKEPKIEVKVRDKGSLVPEEIQLEEEILDKEVGLGSYNLIKGVIKNTADHYAATTLKLAVPDEVEVLGRNRRTILLEPEQVKETFWIVKIKDNLEQNFAYTFPAVIYSEKNVSVEDSFAAQQGKNIYTQPEIQKLTVQNEEKSYSRKIAMDCTYPHELLLGEQATVQCTVKNAGNANIQKINFCLGGVCEFVDLAISQQKQSQITINGDQVGWHNLVVSAVNDLIEKKSSLSYVVLDAPKVSVKLAHPISIAYSQPFDITAKLKKESFNSPLKIVVLIQGYGFENRWDVSELSEEKELVLKLDNVPLSPTNKFEVTTTWKDKTGKMYSDKQEITILGQGRTFMENIKLYFNGFLKIFRK